jgi:trehalose synthase-fused probable maltokinase
MRIRCHGDYHLGQILFTGKDFVIIDFEGEPGRPLTARRIKASPLKDVAGMIRSFHYAAHAGRFREVTGSLSPAQAVELEQWAQAWYQWTASTFLRAYLAEIAPTELLPAHSDHLRVLLNAYILEKMVYEMTYELNNRPDWVILPLQGILEIC